MVMLLDGELSRLKRDFRAQTVGRIENPTYPVKVKRDRWESTNFSVHLPDIRKQDGQQATTEPLTITYFGDKTTLIEYR